MKYLGMFAAVVLAVILTAYAMSDYKIRLHSSNSGSVAQAPVVAQCPEHHASAGVRELERIVQQVHHGGREKLRVGVKVRERKRMPRFEPLRQPALAID